ncbi:MAG TPA: hypothetical protein VFZ05_02105 [Nitrososphaera sp.]
MAGSREAYAQSEESVTVKYSDPGRAFVIKFPEGWSGSEVDGRYVVTTAGPEPASITLYTAHRLDARELITSEAGDSLAASAAASCSVANDFAQAGNAVAFHSVSECPDPEDYQKTDTYVILTLTKSIVISYSAASAEAYDAHMADFQDSLQTMVADEPVSFRSVIEVALGTTNIFVLPYQIGGNSTTITIATSSGIPSVSFDEETKKLTIMVDEKKREEGRLLMPIGRFLLGPYQVHVNGEPSQDFLVIDDEESASQLLYVSYGQGPHEIVITAAEVIPEFDAVAMGILATVIAGVVLYHRYGGGKAPRNNPNGKGYFAA